MATKTKSETADFFNPAFVKETFENYAAQNAKFFEKSFGASPVDFDKFSTQWMKSLDQAMALGQANTQAFIKAGDIWLKGFETLSATVAATAKEEMETSVSAAKSIMDCKTVQDVVDAQTSFAKGRYDKMVNESTKLTEMVRSVANDAAAPIAESFTATVEAVKTEATKATKAA